MLSGQVAVYPGYNTMQQFPADAFPPHRRHRSRTRIFFSRAVHALMLLVVVAFFMPILMRGVARVSHAVSAVLYWKHCDPRVNITTTDWLDSQLLS